MIDSRWQPRHPLHLVHCTNLRDKYDVIEIPTRKHSRSRGYCMDAFNPEIETASYGTMASWSEGAAVEALVAAISAAAAAAVARSICVSMTTRESNSFARDFGTDPLVDLPPSTSTLHFHPSDALPLRRQSRLFLDQARTYTRLHSI